MVALLDKELVLAILIVRPGGLHDPVDLVDFAVETTGGDEARQLLIDERRRHAKRLRHVLQSEGLVGLQQLIVGQDAHLPDVVVVVGGPVTVKLELLLNLRWKPNQKNTKKKKNFEAKKTKTNGVSDDR